MIDFKLQGYSSPESVITFLNKEYPQLKDMVYIEHEQLKSNNPRLNIEYSKTSCRITFL